MHWDQNGPEQRSSQDFADWNIVLVKMCKNFLLLIFILVSHLSLQPFSVCFSMYLLCNRIVALA